MARTRRTRQRGGRVLRWVFRQPGATFAPDSEDVVFADISLSGPALRSAAAAEIAGLFAAPAGRSLPGRRVCRGSGAALALTLLGSVEPERVGLENADELRTWSVQRAPKRPGSFGRDA